jgi:hypothetical protein
MSWWEAMKLIAEQAGLLLHVRRDGVWETYDPLWVSAALYDFQLGTAAAWDTYVQDVEHIAEGQEGVTGVIVKGEDVHGSIVSSWLLDFSREKPRRGFGTFAALFAGCRMLKRIEGKQFDTTAACSIVAGAEYDRQQQTGYIVAFHTAGRPDVYRRDAFRIVGGLPVGIVATSEHWIRDIAHEWGPQMVDAKTTMTGMRY